MEYRIELPYTESKPGTKEYVAVYDIETRSPDQALKIARKKFSSYENYNSASWVRTIQDSKMTIRLKFGEFLCPLGDKDCLNGLIRKFAGLDGGNSSDSEHLCAAAGEAVHFIPLGPILVSTLISVFDKTCEAGRFDILTCLSRDPTPPPPESFDLIGRLDSERALATYLKYISQSRSPRAGEIISSYLQHSDNRVRANAVEALENFGDLERGQAIFAMLSDPNNRVQANAIKAIHNLYGADMSANITAMAASPDKWKRASMAYALGEILVPNRETTLLKFLDDPDVSVRFNAARSLNRVCLEAPNPSLMKHIVSEHLSGEDETVKAELKAILVRHASSTIDILVSSLSEKQLRRDVGEVLDTIKNSKLEKKDYMGWLGISLKRFLRGMKFCLTVLGLLFTTVSPAISQLFTEQAPRPMTRPGQSQSSGDTAINLRNIDPYSFPVIGVHCTVSISGVPAHGLTRKDFSLTEGTREIENFEIVIKGLPIDVAMILDTSGSVRNFVSDIKTGAKLFVSLMKNSDRASVTEFSDSVIQTQPLTSDRGLLNSVIDEIRASGGTKLYDGMLRGLSDLNPDRGVLVVMTDGRDVRRAGDIERYSEVGPDQVLAEALRRKVPVFAIGVGIDIDREGLEGIAGKTGGAFFQTLDPKGISEIFQKISGVINCHYMITYTSPVPESRGEWRKVQVRAVEGGAAATAEYCVPLPPELAARTQPIDTVRLYGLFGTGLKITTHDKDYLVAEVKVLGSDERFLSRMTTEITGRTFWMLMRGGKRSDFGGSFRDGKGTGARIFNLISGQKFFFCDEGKALPYFDLKVPRGCTVEIYGPSCPVEIGDTGGSLTVIKRSGTSPVTVGNVGALSILSQGTSVVQVAGATGRIFIVASGTSDITVDSGEATELFASTRGTGDVVFGGFASEAELFCSGTGNIIVGTLAKAPRKKALNGVGAITVRKGQGSIAYDPLSHSSSGEMEFSISLPDAPPFPGLGAYWGDSGDEVLISDNIGAGNFDEGTDSDGTDSDETGDDGGGYEMPDVSIPDIDVPDGSDFSGDDD